MSAPIGHVHGNTSNASSPDCDKAPQASIAHCPGESGKRVKIIAPHAQRRRRRSLGTQLQYQLRTRDKPDAAAALISFPLPCRLSSLARAAAAPLLRPAYFCLSHRWHYNGGRARGPARWKCAIPARLQRIAVNPPTVAKRAFGHGLRNAGFAARRERERESDSAVYFGACFYFSVRLLKSYWSE